MMGVMANDPGLRTTVVGSYPLPSWLAAAPSTPNLRDAILVAVRTQELAGIDVVSDGELSRFNVNHPETNGMIEYFVRPMQGVRHEFVYEPLGIWQQHSPRVPANGRPLPN